MNSSLYSSFIGSKQYMLACLLLVLLNLGEKTNAFTPNPANQRITSNTPSTDDNEYFSGVGNNGVGGSDYSTQLQLQHSSQQTQPSQQYHQQYQQHEWQQQHQQQQQYQRTAHLMMVTGPVQSDRTGGRGSSTPATLSNYRFLSSARNNYHSSQRSSQDSFALDASSLFLDIPTDPEILKTAAMVFAGGFSWGAGISWLIDGQAEAFRRRFFRKAEAEGGIIPPQYSSTQPKTTTSTRTTSKQWEMNRLERLQQRYKLQQQQMLEQKLASAQMQQQQAHQVVPSAPFTSSVRGTAPSPAVVGMTGTAAMAGTSGTGSSGSSSAKKSFSPTKWSPNMPLTNTGFVGGNAYLGAMATTSTTTTSSSIPSGSSTTASSFPPSGPNPFVGGVPVTQTTTATSVAPVKKSYGPSKWSPSNPQASTGFTGGNSYFGTMSTTSVPPTGATYGSSTAGTAPVIQTTTTTGPVKKSYSPSKWSPSNSKVSSGFTGGNSYFGTMSNSPSPGFSNESYSPSPPPPITTTATTTPVGSAPFVQTTTQVKKSYSPSKWSPSNNKVSSGFAGGNSYFGTMSNTAPNPVVSSYSTYDTSPSSPPAQATTTTTNPTPSYPTSSMSAPASSSTSYMSSLSTPSSNNVNTGSQYSAGGVDAPKKSYSMSKWSPSTGSSSGGSSTFTGGNSYFNNLSNSGSSTGTAPSTYTSEINTYNTPASSSSSSAHSNPIPPASTSTYTTPTSPYEGGSVNNDVTDKINGASSSSSASEPIRWSPVSSGITGSGSGDYFARLSAGGGGAAAQGYSSTSTSTYYDSETATLEKSFTASQKAP